MKKYLIALAGAVALYASPAAAQVGFEANGAYSEEVWGGELGVGYSVKAGPMSFRAVGGAFIYKGDNDRYFMDNNGGNPRCRDRANGHYASDIKCDDTAVKPYGRAEALFTTPKGFSLGAGARISDEVRPYGTVAFRIGPKAKIKGNAGPHYYALGVTLGF